MIKEPSTVRRAGDGDAQDRWDPPAQDAPGSGPSVMKGDRSPWRSAGWVVLLWLGGVATVAGIAYAIKLGLALLLQGG